ncbi:HlyD family type I secretion periplasmic adaptor subunit [Azospirillum sp.]|uniref:HlyD family type I secretion periplasmic adaptor subunit n=1 Tax=Azospirillum sp. TaxID=34012 RepID=UPI002D7A22E5|nr:HlyD family type I secretion periplasmic adaptor subunit [Azospirillum sp.]
MTAVSQNALTQDTGTVPAVSHAGLPQTTGLPPSIDRRPPSPPWRKASLAGYLMILVFFGGFGTWAATVPLGSAVIAQGSLRVDTARKTVQPIISGVVDELLVQEGQMVREGQVLVRLNRLQTEAQLDLVRNQYYAVRVQEARLLAERDQLPAIVYPAEIEALRGTPLVDRLIETQQNVFAKRRLSLEGQAKILNERIAQTRTEINAFTDRRKSLVKQLELIHRETEGVRELYNKGMERLPRLLAQERAEVSMQGDINNLDASVARAYQRVGEMELQIIDLTTQFDKGISDELRTADVQLNDLRERTRIAQDNLRHLDIAAPRSGRVVDLKIHTVGGLVQAGQPLFDIVPQDDELIVEARVLPRDIDNVSVGASVQVRLTSFSQRYTHPIDATLVSISADAITEQGNPIGPYYRALIRLDKEARERVLPGIELASGMPVMCLISVGERTLLAYWLTPLLQSFELALREP